MFGTIIIDAYRQDESGEVAEALEYLCSSLDANSWGSAGIYCFWDYYSREILYIGLASDLCRRFKQHNRLITVDDRSCKYRNITEYFDKKEKLGYTVFLQSPLEQPIIARNEKRYKEMLGDEFYKCGYIGQEGLDDMKLVEGILIEVFKRKNDTLPRWNKIGGSVKGQKKAKYGNYEIIKAFNKFENHPLVSKYTLRELCNEPNYLVYETHLHGVRMLMLTCGDSLEEALNCTSEFVNNGIREEIIAERYFEKQLIV